DISGAQDANYFTGDFGISVVESYEIINGELGKPILPFFCSGNIFKILEDTSLLLGKKKEEIIIPATPLSVIIPEVVTSRVTITI
ncbi:MAG: metallopeptidase TldD-related protein, partial [Candidatus Thorarchaeota archaeon]